MDLSPFNNINPCGYAGLKMTQVKAFLSDIDPEEIRSKLVNYFIDQLYHVA